MTARTRVHRGDEREARGIGGGIPGARDRDRALLERFAECFEDGRREFRELVEEECAAVREANFARPWRRAAADEREVRGGVVRRAERARSKQRALGID